MLAEKALTIRLDQGELHLLYPSPPGDHTVRTRCGIPAWSGKCEGPTDSLNIDINEVCDNCVKAWANEG